MTTSRKQLGRPAMAPVRTTHSHEELAELLELCRQGRLFDVQAWIEAGKALQLAEPVPRRTSALRVAVEAGNHSLVQVLLVAGYDSNLERESPLTWALADRRGDLVDLLLEHGCDPKRVGLYNLFMTYDRELITRFYALGVDLTAGHELAGFLRALARARIALVVVLRTTRSRLLQPRLAFRSRHQRPGGSRTLRSESLQ